ncbi:hypothetical protein BDV38DRAFT_263513 [Aspergillus pseudotamarii]|uniref:Uncharacterized protein n=1 Tax=Aspergillus pseudotamarii TaxID=132259 RepID=A0A5N6SDJ0_ASPPS|nr:uncharacterized protein BDV38DRAFT_263513 [Aspergillus pseudotamarii]KAE8131741.1 hypothetical protein BDV38DRAFT_263513 [Aspergillus pseudotamarii]
MDSPPRQTTRLPTHHCIRCLSANHGMARPMDMIKDPLAQIQNQFRFPTRLIIVQTGGFMTMPINLWELPLTLDENSLSILILSIGKPLLKDHRIDI